MVDCVKAVWFAWDHAYGLSVVLGGLLGFLTGFACSLLAIAKSGTVKEANG